MSITTMIDEFDQVSVVIFPSLYKRVSHLLNSGNYVVVDGKIEIKENVSLIANNIREFKVKVDSRETLK